MTTEICKHCNGWRGLHRWDTMQCPYMGYENEMWQETTYEEADETAAATLASQAARIAELEAFVGNFEGNFEKCADCENGADVFGDACRICGGTGDKILSHGVLLAELLPSARALLAQKG